MAGRTLAAIVFVTACRGEQLPDTGLVIQSEPDWAVLNDSLPADPGAQASILEAYRQRSGLPMLFRPALDSALLARAGIVVHDHACGPVVSAFVKSIPQEHPTLATQFALEVDSAGNALQRWELPLGVVVMGVSGSDLLVAPGPRPTDVYMRVRPDGSFILDAGRSGLRPASVWPQGICPNRPELAGLLCEEFRDGERRRILLHSPPCGAAPSVPE